MFNILQKGYEQLYNKFKEEIMDKDYKSQSFNHSEGHFHDRGTKLLLDSIFHCENSTLSMIQEIENNRGKTITPLDPFKSAN
jgi:hypothetical protein